MGLRNKWFQPLSAGPLFAFRSLVSIKLIYEEAYEDSLPVTIEPFFDSDCSRRSN